MPTAGTRNRYNHGCHRKNATNDASPRSKKCPTMKVKKPVNSMKMTMNTYATGEAK